MDCSLFENGPLFRFVEPSVPQAIDPHVSKDGNPPDRQLSTNSCWNRSEQSQREDNFTSTSKDACQSNSDLISNSGKTSLWQSSSSSSSSSLSSSSSSSSDKDKQNPGSIVDEDEDESDKNTTGQKRVVPDEGDEDEDEEDEGDEITTGPKVTDLDDGKDGRLRKTSLPSDRDGEPSHNSVDWEGFGSDEEGEEDGLEKKAPQKGGELDLPGKDVLRRRKIRPILPLGSDEEVGPMDVDMGSPVAVVKDASDKMEVDDPVVGVTSISDPPALRRSSRYAMMANMPSMKLTTPPRKAHAGRSRRKKADVKKVEIVPEVIIEISFSQQKLTYKWLVRMTQMTKGRNSRMLRRQT